MQKSGASENVEDYLKEFKPDSSYADLWNGDKEKDELTKSHAFWIWIVLRNSHEK